MACLSCPGFDCYLSDSSLLITSTTLQMGTFHQMYNLERSRNRPPFIIGNLNFRINVRTELENVAYFRSLRFHSQSSSFFLHFDFDWKAKILWTSSNLFPTVASICFGNVAYLGSGWPHSQSDFKLVINRYYMHGDKMGRRLGGGSLDSITSTSW